MPAFEGMDRRDVAVYWPKTGVDKFNEPTRGTPCQIRLNWSADKRVQRLPDGTNVDMEGTAVVGQVMCLGDIVWLGRLSDFDPDAIPAGNPLMHVVRFKEDADIKGRHVYRTVTLAKFHRSLPAEG